MNPIETANSSISLLGWIKNLFIRVRIVPDTASFRYLETIMSKYTEVGASFHIENKNSRTITITDARAFVKLDSGNTYESKARLFRNELEPNKVVHETLLFSFPNIKFTNEKKIHVVLHLNAKKEKNFDLELIHIEELSKKRKGTISEKMLEKQRKRMKA